MFSSFFSPILFIISWNFFSDNCILLLNSLFDLVNNVFISSFFVNSSINFFFFWDISLVSCSILNIESLFNIFPLSSFVITFNSLFSFTRRSNSDASKSSVLTPLSITSTIISSSFNLILFFSSLFSFEFELTLLSLLFELFIPLLLLLFSSSFNFFSSFVSSAIGSSSSFKFSDLFKFNSLFDSSWIDCESFWDIFFIKFCYVFIIKYI